MSRTLRVCWMFLWITAANVSANYFLSNETFSWDDAKNKMNFATPVIQVDNSSFKVNITTDLNQNEDAWVGYFKKETAFEYIGCGRLTNTEPKVWLTLKRNSPGNCFSVCKQYDYNHIGLNNGTCFCLSVILNDEIKFPECDISYDGNWIAGGKEYMSIYRAIETDINVAIQNSGKCLVFQQNKEVFWAECDEADQKLCKNGESFEPVFHASSQFFFWRHYVKTCFVSNFSAINFHGIFNSPTLTPKSTNVIRSDVIYKFNEKANAISKDNSVKYGYITKRGSVTFLLFNKTSSNKRYLFQIDSETVTNPTSEQIRTSTTQTSTTKTTRLPLDNGTTPRNTSSLPIKSSSITTAHTSSTSSVNDGITNSSEPLQSISETIISESSDVSVPVSISVVAVIIVAVIVTIITLKRRGKLQGICTKGSALDNLSKRISDIIPAENKLKNSDSAVDDYEQISELKDNHNVDVKPDLDVGNGNYGHTYFVLEPGSRESHTDGDISDFRKEETEINDDYNTLHLNKTFGTKADDTYDTTEKAAIKLKALRDTGCDKESPKKLNGNDEDTYNHISRNLLKNNKTDNIYGVTDNQENDNGDVNKDCKKNLHDGDDTYSHLNTTH
ncbi:putative uncharacterized protein DDB_G0277255 [Ruditapes philippinarum]|uniref:putative uncharacterized protein DDB_G0277255 n=1 Tax=Ruditapes philippinarum TaxID=129788 RepID=UPI00295B09AA|nr:putative uncharacterized protein DDB_G0277255 [Ruditapes philippinarum]